MNAFFFLFCPREKKALLAQRVGMDYKGQWVYLALLDHLGYLEKMETRPVTKSKCQHLSDIH